MKLPKELQKKKQKITPNYEELKRKLINTFKNEIIFISQKFSEKRKILFKNPNDISIFSDVIDESLVEIEKDMYNAKTHWNESTIEFYINDGDNTNYFIELKRDLQNFSFLKPIFRYIARHEYGHTFLAKSTYYLRPKGGREVLKKFGYKNLYHVPEEERNRVFEQIKNTNFFKWVEELKNIDLGLLENEYKEFHANYIIFTRINNSSPIETLKWKYHQLLLFIKNLKQRKDEILTNLRKDPKLGLLKRNVFYTLYHFIFLNTPEIYLFGEWDRLIPLFKEEGHIYFLYFMSLINEVFLKIADTESNLDSMHLDLIEFGKIMEKVDYGDLIFNDIFPENIQKDIKQFKSSITNRD